MSGKFKNILLICSLMFNITLISYIVYRGYSIKTAPSRRVGYQKDYSEQHKERIGQIREKRTEFVQARKEFCLRLSESEVNKEELDQQLEEVIEKQIAMEKTIGRNLIEMRMNMEADEAEDFFRKILQRYKSPRAPRRNR